MAGSKPPSIRRVLWADFDDIGTPHLYAMLRLRCDVFVVEQNCPYPDIDGLDSKAAHLLVWLDAGEPLSGCLRVFLPYADCPFAKIGRVATAKAVRGTGLGRWMMLEALSNIDARHPGATTEIGAQVAMEGFYTSLGFLRVSEDYDEDGIAHCTMMRASGKA